MFFKNFYFCWVFTSCIKPRFLTWSGNLVDNPPVRKKSQASSVLVFASREKWSHERGEGLKIRYEWGRGEAEAEWCEGEVPPSPSFNSLTKDGLINKSITHTRGAGRMNAYRVDKDRGEDVDKIGGCPRVLVVEQRGARHGINVWPPRQNIHARSRVPADPLASNRESGPIAPFSSPLFSVPFSSRTPYVDDREQINSKIIANLFRSLITKMQLFYFIENLKNFCFRKDDKLIKV